MLSCASRTCQPVNPITVRSDSAAIRLSALAAAAITHRSFCAALCASPQQGADSFFSVEGCVEDEDNVTISTFRAGKGAAFWGPFTNQELRLLSGHKREDTLPRYLGWGRFSADALRAAVARDRRVEGGAAQHEPAKMGLFSGRGGDKGRRVQTPPDAGRPFLPQRPPKARRGSSRPKKSIHWIGDVCARPLARATVIATPRSTSNLATTC